MPRSLLVRSLLFALLTQAVSPVVAEDSAEAWRQLFNGRDLDGWLVKLHGHDLDDNYRDTYRVEEGLLKVRYDKYDEGGFGDRFGHLFYDEPFSHYHLAIEYRFHGDLMPSAPKYARLNSGVMLHAQDPRTILKGQDWPISIELQFLACIPGGGPRATGNVCTPGTHLTYQGKLDKTHVIRSSAPTFAADEWVRIEALVRGDRIIHLVNGEPVLEYSRPVIGGGVVSGYDPGQFVEGKPLTSGYIALQAEGNGLDVRKVEIRVLPQE